MDLELSISGLLYLSNILPLFSSSSLCLFLNPEMTLPAWHLQTLSLILLLKSSIPADHRARCYLPGSRHLQKNPASALNTTDTITIYFYSIWNVTRAQNYFYLKKLACWDILCWFQHHISSQSSFHCLLFSLPSGTPRWLTQCFPLQHCGLLISNSLGQSLQKLHKIQDICRKRGTRQPSCTLQFNSGTTPMVPSWPF